MRGEVDCLDFLVAEKLSMSLGQVRALPNAEMEEWRVFYEFRSAMEDFYGR